MEEKLLKIIFKRYTKKYDYGVRNLKEYKEIITDRKSFEKDMPEIVEFEGDTKTYLLIPILEKLMAKGYIEFSEDNAYYCLTESGYNHAAQNIFQRIIAYFNKNAGWVILIAILSLIVALVALFVK